MRASKQADSMNGQRRGPDLLSTIADVDAATLRRIVAETAERNPEVRAAVAAALHSSLGSTQDPRSDLSKRLIGHCPEMGAVRKAVLQVAETSLPVLITGESGTGKDLVAREVHTFSAQADGPFVAVNCGAIPASLITSEMFGHERGSFTGAVAQQIGQIEQAQNGTLFLDEIGELPGDVQATMLRFLQDFRIRRVGGKREIPVNCRIVAATNVDLRVAVEEGRFRRDLFFRLDVFPIHLPPLRERGDDMLTLAEVFMDAICEELRRPPITMSKDARKVIRSYHWPGNVRELSSKLRKAVVLCRGDRLTADDLGFLKVAFARQRMTTRQRGPKVTRDQVSQSLRRNGGNITATGRELGVSRVTVYKLIERYKLNQD